MTALEAEITVAKGGAPILSGVRVRCKAGQCLVVLGENGAGKSVLLRSLALGEAGATGEMCVLGRTFQLADGVPEDGPWPDLTIVLQSLALWPHLTAADNVLLPWQRRDPARRLDREALDRLFNRLDITDLLTRYPAQLSGGQRQRVALARALALRPRVLLLDEPSAALDARRSLAVLSLLAEAKADGVALILVTHSLGFAARLADSYVFLHQGSLVDSGAWNLISQSASPELRAYLELNAFSQ